MQNPQGLYVTKKLITSMLSVWSDHYHQHYHYHYHIISPFNMLSRSLTSDSWTRIVAQFFAASVSVPTFIAPSTHLHRSQYLLEQE